MSDARERGERMRAFAGNTLDDYYDHDIRDHPLPGRLLIGAIVRILWVVTKFLWPWRVENVELLTQDPRGRVIIMNHESMLDPVAVVRCALCTRATSTASVPPRGSSRARAASRSSAARPT